MIDKNGSYYEIDATGAHYFPGRGTEKASDSWLITRPYIYIPALVLMPVGVMIAYHKKMSTGGYIVLILGSAILGAGLGFGGRVIYEKSH